MSTDYGLKPPWGTDQGALNAAEILDHVQRRTGEFRELNDAGVTCNHEKHTTRPVRYFSGTDDDGELRTWLLVSGHRLKGREVPALCTPLPRPGELAVTMYARCGRCRAGWLLFPGGLPVEMQEKRDSGEPVRVVSSVGSSWADPFEAGDETDYFEGREWFNGPGSVVVLSVDPHVQGKVAL